MSLAETMLFVGQRSKLWDGQGVMVKEAPTSAEAIKLAGLDWKVESRKMYTSDGIEVPNAFANVRDRDNKVLGVVGKRYQIVQNSEAFEFTDSLIGEGVRYETAGALGNGSKIWLLAKLPSEYKVLGDIVDPYVVFTNSFDGSGSIKVACTPVRVWCSNTLNAALKGAKRTWSARHSGSVNAKLEEARETLELADTYMQMLGDKFEELHKIKMDDDTVRKAVKTLSPIKEDATERAIRNAEALQDDILSRYFNMPDLVVMDKTAARFINAVADSTSHKEPLRRTQNWRENLFDKQIDGNPLLDKAIALVSEIV